MTLLIEFKDGTECEALEVDDFQMAGTMLLLVSVSALGSKEGKIAAGINVDTIKTFKVVGLGRLVVPLTEEEKKSDL